ncbi:glycosyltransferase family 2 protein [Salibacteraceae bacterium]|nr:glycosyltransferase family 2 protein [Salibacteraceae bacterium]MDC1204074.1 glycosyltransferase family 2 protein [Salibacteraceae bacterium]
MEIAIVSPIYLAEKVIPELVKRLVNTLENEGVEFEIVLVDDNSPDKSWEVIQKLAKSEKRLKGIRLSKNFGQHYAISAGIENTLAEWVVVMDCDLQDRPEDIPVLYKKSLSGFDLVVAKRNRHGDSYFKRLSSLFFYIVLNWLTGVKYDENLGNFGIYNKKVINSINNMRESIRCFPIMIHWVGFNQGTIEVNHDKRLEGKSTYSIRKLLKLSLDIILAYSDKPIRLVVKLGVVISLLAVFFGAYTLIQYFSGNILVPGYSSIIISIWFLFGATISILGVIGLYVGKTFEGVKNRPIYIITETAN